MEESTQGEDVLPDYPSDGTSKNSPRIPRKSIGNPDFDDVFGGPPRRFSLEEVRVRYSFSEQGRIPSPLSARTMGEEKPARRRFLRDDFFDDIFRGEESSCSPRTSHPDRDFACGSNPSSRITSPAPNPPPIIPSSPTQLSLPANPSNSMDFSTLVSENHMQFKSGSTGNRLSSPLSSSSSSIYYVPSPLASFSGEDSPSTCTSDSVRKLEQHARNVEFPMNGNQFHFSIHKWAGKGVPMLAPIDSSTFRNTSKSCRFVRSDGKSEGEFTERKSSIKANQVLSVDVESEASRVSCEKEVYRSKEDRGELQCSTEEEIYGDLVCEWPAAKNSKAKGVKSVEKTDSRKKVKNKVTVKSEMKPLRAFLIDEVEKSETKESENVGSVGDDAIVQDRRNVEKADEAGGDSNGEAMKAPKGFDKFEVKEKISEVVQIFNHEARSVHRPGVQTQNQCCEGQGTVINEKGSEMHLNGAKLKEQVDEHPNEGEGLFKAQKKAPSFRNRTSKISVEISDDPLENHFLVQELSSGPEKVAPSDDDPEEIKTLDAKIQQWSAEKKGNIRSLLSTLQFVLWPGSGLKPVPLVDLIEANAVKRAYQKALLRLHPDKLQQNGAAFHQKYIAEKVFDILQDAWDQFNMISPL